MSHLKLAVIRTNDKNGFPVEFHIEEPTAEGVTQMVAALIQHGYTAPRAASRAEGANNDGKIATVKEKNKVPDKKQWKIKAIIDGEGNGFQEFIIFNEHELRVGDRIRLVKNDKGYITGVLLTNEESQKSTDDIPF